MLKVKVNSPIFVYIDSHLSLKVQYVTVHDVTLSCFQSLVPCLKFTLRNVAVKKKKTTKASF